MDGKSRAFRAMHDGKSAESFSRSSQGWVYSGRRNACWQSQLSVLVRRNGFTAFREAHTDLSMSLAS
jgi:hypothetical protein